MPAVCVKEGEKRKFSLSLLSFLLVCLSVFDYLYHFLTIRKRAFFFFLMCAANDVIIAVKKRGKKKKSTVRNGENLTKKKKKKRASISLMKCGGDVTMLAKEAISKLQLLCVFRASPRGYK